MSSKRRAWNQKHDVAMRDLKRLSGAPFGVCCMDGKVEQGDKEGGIQNSFFLGWIW